MSLQNVLGKACYRYNIALQQGTITEGIRLIVFERIYESELTAEAIRSGIDVDEPSVRVVVEKDDNGMVIAPLAVCRRPRAEGSQRVSARLDAVIMPKLEQNTMFCEPKKMNFFSVSV